MEWAAFLEEWFKKFKLPPSGGPDDPRTQRVLLWPVVRDYPSRSAAWLSEAPEGVDSFHAVEHVRRSWRRELEKAAA